MLRRELRTILLSMAMIVCLVKSHPYQVNCDLSSTASPSDNVMTKSSIMGRTPEGRSDLITATEDTVFGLWNLNLNNLLNGGLVLHASNGHFELPTDEGIQRVTCSNGADLFYIDETSGNDTVAESMTLQWTNTSIGATTVTFSLISGESNARAVRRQRLTLPENSSPDSGSSSSSDDTLKIVLIVVFVLAFLLVAIGWGVYHHKFHGKLINTGSSKKSSGEEFAPRTSKRMIFHPHGHDAESNDESKQLSSAGGQEDNL